MGVVDDGVAHDEEEDDTGEGADADVDLGVMRTKHDPAVSWLGPTEVVLLGECEECED